MANQVTVEDTMLCRACGKETLHLQSSEGFWKCETCGNDTLSMTRVEWEQFTS